MKKDEAIKIARDKYSLDLTKQNTHYSSMNASKPVWWIEVSMDKIMYSGIPRLYFLLQQKNSVLVLDIPTSFLCNSADGFRVRSDKDCMCFEIDLETFRDVIGPKKIDLKQFLLSP